jgi:hypothetical protein
VAIELLAAGELLELCDDECGFGIHVGLSFHVPRPRHAASIKEEGARGLDGGRARDRRGITRLHKRSAEGGETEPEVVDLALERRGARYNGGFEAAKVMPERTVGGGNEKGSKVGQGSTLQASLLARECVFRGRRGVRARIHQP